MKRRLQNLERLCMKMHYRYGDADPFVQLLHSELNQAAVQPKSNLQWWMEYRRKPSDRHVRLEKPAPRS